MNTENNFIHTRFIQEATQYPNYQLARVIVQYRGMYKIIYQNQEIIAEVSGKLRHEVTQSIAFPTVGDYVMVSIHENSHAIIHHILKRKSIFTRSTVASTNQLQPVAANIDTVFICMSLNQNYNLNRLERYLSIAWQSGASPVIILTKSDLCDDIYQKIMEVESVSMFSDVVAISKYDNNILDKFKKYTKPGNTCAFIGSSGVGKSTLVNTLLESEVLETQDTSKDDKGRHTTTTRELFYTSSNCAIIDTPGMRELGVDSGDVSQSFDDIEQLATMCKFSNCSHTSEPGCAILEALNDGSLEQRRFDNYLKIKAEIGYDGLSARQIEEKKFEKYGGFKNIQKISQEARAKKNK